MARGPVIELWKKVKPKRSAPNERAIEALGKLLATKFASGRSLMKRRVLHDA